MSSFQQKQYQATGQYLYQNQKPFSYTAGIPFAQYISQLLRPRVNRQQIVIQSQPNIQPTFHQHLHTPSSRSRIIMGQNQQSFNSLSSSRVMAAQVKNQQVIKGKSQISYIPYQKKVIEYQTRTFVQKVPVKKKIIQYQQKKVIQQIPHEVVRQQFMAVQHRVQYHKEVIPQKKIQMISRPKTIKRYEYVPVQKQIVHYPQGVNVSSVQGESRLILKNQGIQIKSDAQFRPIDPTLLYKYSDRPESKYKPIGYAEDGNVRPFSNTCIPLQNNTPISSSYITSPPQYRTDTAYTPLTNLNGSNIKKVDSFSDLAHRPNPHNFNSFNSEISQGMNPFDLIKQNYYQQRRQGSKSEVGSYLSEMTRQVKE